MKKLFLLIFTTLFTHANDIALTVSGAQQTQMPIAIIVLDEKNNELNEIAAVIKKDLQFTDQFKPTIKKCDAHTSNKLLKKTYNSYAIKEHRLPCVSAVNQKAASRGDYMTPCNAL